VSRDDRRSQIAASIVALLAATSLWLSAGTVAVISGDTHRIAALPSIWILPGLAIAAVVAATMARLRIEEAWPLLGTLLIWLPYLPGKVPPPFLIWQGPTEAFVWSIAIAGVVAVRLRKAPSLLANPDRAPWIAGAIVAVAALAVLGQVRGVIPGGDEPHYLAATQSILKDFDLRVANNYADGDYLDYFPGRLEPHFLKRSTSGEIYSIHAPGVSIVVLPGFAVAGYAGAVLTMILIAALTAAITWRLAWRMSGSVAGAWAGIAAVFATTPYFFHTFTIYPEIIGSLCVAIGAWLLVDLADGREATSGRLVATGAALALLPWLHSRFAVIAAALGVVIVLRLRSLWFPIVSIARFLSVPAIAGAAWFAFFWLIWGSPSPVSPYGADTSTSTSYILRGLIGLMIDQQFGLIATAPVYLLAIAGLVVLARQRPRLAGELALVAVPYAIAVASYAMWWAGSAAPARFLIAILPLAALPIAVMFSGKVRWSSITVAVILLIVSMGLVVPRAMVESGRFIYNNRGSLDATLEWLSQSVDLPGAFPSVHRDGGAIAIRDAGAWLAVAIGIHALMAGVRKRSLAILWAVGSIALGVGVMLGASIVWSLHGSTAVTEDRSKLAAFGAYRPSWQKTTMDISERRSISQAELFDAFAFRVRTSGSRINRVPAGDYKVHANVGSIEPVSMSVGRNDPPIEAPSAEDLHDDRSSFRLRLPVTAQTLNFQTPGAVPEDGPMLVVTPVATRRPAYALNAVRANRYGHARAFFFDDSAYPERDGFWTRANGAATVVIDTDEGTRLSGLPITIVAGAESTTVRLSVGKWEESFALAAGQKQDIVLPPAESGAWPLRIRSGQGFRPSERDRGSRDVRSLAAWIAIH
jgi:hypothetical protein